MLLVRPVFIVMAAELILLALVVCPVIIVVLVPVVIIVQEVILARPEQADQVVVPVPLPPVHIVQLAAPLIPALLARPVPIVLVAALVMLLVRPELMVRAVLQRALVPDHVLAVIIVLEVILARPEQAD
jgi:hypothetical protein